MLHIRKSFHSLASAAIFLVLGLLYSMSALSGTPIILSGLEIATPMSWAVVGLMFVMAYFSLVHITHED